MKLSILLILLLCACTTKTEKGVYRKDLIIWDLERTYKKTHINDSLKILYKTCFDSKNRKYDFWESLRSEFKKKFDIELIGLSTAESRSFYIKDSSVFVANEVCLHITGNPVTVQVLKTELKEVEFHDPKHHVH